MKGSNALKTLFALCSITVASVLYAGELGSILSNNKALSFEYQLQSNELESDKLTNSWMSPVRLQYGRNYSTQFGDQTIDTGSYSVIVDQPIFRSGGIYYGIKYAQAFRDANEADIQLQKRTMIGDAVSILFSLKKTKLEQEKMRFQIKNDAIDIMQKRESYEAGLLDSSFLDQAMLKKSQDETTLLQLELNMMEFKQKFSLLSDKNPNNLRLPSLKLMSKTKYREENLELKRDRLRAQQSDYNEKVTWAKYLPTVSLQGQYTDGDINPLFARPDSFLQEKYYNYGFSVSMPLDINAFSDIELAKVEKLKAAVEVLDKKEQIKEEYNWIENSLGILDKKIALARKDERVYASLYTLTKNLAHAGEKTSFDADVMRNSLQIRKLDQQIFAIDKQIQLLKLYVRAENAL
jgi:outer membrane protein TolC